MSLTDDTLLLLEGVGIPRYSARGMTQTLAPIDELANVRRTINGTAIDLSADQFQKFKSSLSASDQAPPAIIGGKWPGAEVVVHCVAELVRDEYEDASRPVVSGSERDNGDGFIFYRPILTMIVLSFSVSKDEWGAVIGWQMDLIEK